MPEQNPFALEQQMELLQTRMGQLVFEATKSLTQDVESLVGPLHDISRLSQIHVIANFVENLIVQFFGAINSRKFMSVKNSVNRCYSSEVSLTSKTL